MNTLIGKSSGIALLMAAALLAALFAMGVFSASGVGAAVENSGKQAPAAVVVVGEDETTTPGADNDATLRVTFQVDDEVDGAGGLNDDVIITIPRGLITGVSDTTADGAALSGDELVTGTGFGSSSFDGKVTVMQGDGDDAKAVGAVTNVWDSNRGLEITIGPADDNDDNLMADQMVTVEVMDLRITQANAVYRTTIDQGNSRARATTERFFALTQAQAILDDDDLQIKFTSALASDAGGGSVTITLGETELEVGDTVTGSTGVTVDTIAEGNEITVSAYPVGEITITVDGKGTADETVSIEQGSQTVEIEVGEIPPSPVTLAGAQTDGGKISTLDAGASSVRLTINARIIGTATTGLARGEDITIDLGDFVLPALADVTTNDVIIIGDGNEPAGTTNTGGVAEFYGNPATIGISGSKVTLGLPTTTAAGADSLGLLGSGDGTDDNGHYQILFKESFGLGNPIYKGANTIEVDDGDVDDEAKTATIVSTAKVKPAFVTKGGDATVTAMGLRDGTTTVYLVDEDEDDDRGDVLGSGTADDGVVMIDIDTSGLTAGATKMGSKDVGLNSLMVIDANNEQVAGNVILGIKPTVKLGSDTAKRSASLEITVSDWFYGDIYRVSIGGINVSDVDDDENLVEVGNDMKETFNVTVPGNVRGGEQEVKVYGDADYNTTSATAMVTISALALDVAPSVVVPGQRVTITGSGFATSRDVSSIMIGDVDVDVPNDADSTSSGKVAVTVTVPLNVGDGDKAVKLTVGTRTGEGEIVVPKPSIELKPAESVPGSVISVTGSGFAADGRVEVQFDGDIEEVGVADGSGDIHIRLEIPSDAGVGATNEVVVAVRDPDDTDDVEVNISAKAEHKTPGSAITVPETAQVGTLATISGTNFEPFTSLTVMIGGKDATPSPAETDKNGGFELEARVPRLSAGSHTITITDGSIDENSVTETFTVILTPVVSTPEEVFGVLGDSLVSVWSLNNATKVWSAYFPGAPEGVSDLTGVSRGDIVWINVNADVAFQGGMLTTGWNLISLE